jgi:hypothetical protein
LLFNVVGVLSNEVGHERLLAGRAGMPCGRTG